MEGRLRPNRGGVDPACKEKSPRGSPPEPCSRHCFLKRPPRALQERPRALLTTFFCSKRPPRALQEAFKRPSAAITHLRCNPKPYYIDVDLQKEVPEPQKSLNFIEKTMVFEEIAFSVRIASSTPFWTLLASISGASWPPRRAQERPRPLQERPRRLQDRPRSAQDASRTTPRAAKRLQEPSKRAPGGLQEAKMLQEGSRRPF